MSSFNSSTPNFDNLLLQSLMGRLQIRPPPPSSHHSPLLSDHHPSFEDFLLDAAASFRLSSSDEDDEADSLSSDYGGSGKTQLAREEARLEKELIRIILAGDTAPLKPNSGQAVAVGDHHICVGFHEEPGSEYRVWEWHGHILLFDDENGYTPEYIYGNYFERLPGRGGPRPAKRAEKEEEGEEKEDQQEERDDSKAENMGLKELIDNGESAGSRILHRSIASGSPRF